MNHKLAQIRLRLLTVFPQDGLEIFDTLRVFFDKFKPNLQYVTRGNIDDYNKRMPNGIVVENASLDFIENAIDGDYPQYINPFCDYFKNSIPEDAHEVFFAIREYMLSNCAISAADQADLEDKFVTNHSDLSVSKFMSDVHAVLMMTMTYLIYAYMTKDDAKKVFAEMILRMIKFGHYPLWFVGNRIVFIATRFQLES